MLQVAEIEFVVAESSLEDLLKVAHSAGSGQAWTTKDAYARSMALRDFVAQMSKSKEYSVDEQLGLYVRAMKAATSTSSGRAHSAGSGQAGGAEDINLLLEKIAEIPSVKALELVLSHLNDKATVNEAGVAVIQLAMSVAEEHLDKASAAVKKVTKAPVDGFVRRRAAGLVTQWTGGAGKPVSAENAVPGLRHLHIHGRYYRVEGLETARIGKEGTVNTFDVTKTSANYPRCFGVRFLGYVKVPTDGAYTFYVNADNAARLWFGEHVVVDDVRGSSEKSGTIVLKAGLHPIRADYYQNEGSYSMKVEVKGPGMDKQPIPDTMLWHEKVVTPEK
jgi:hypothetical protein